MFLLLFLELHQLLLKHIFQVLYQLFVILLDLGDLDLGSLKDIIFYFVSVSSHGLT